MGIEAIGPNTAPIRKAYDELDKIGRAHVWTPVTFLYLVCRLLLEKKKTKISYISHPLTDALHDLHYYIST